MPRLRALWLMPLIALAALLALARPAAADEVNDSAPPLVAPARALPTRHHIGQLKHSVQTLNNCGPAAIVSALSYWGFDVSQETARRVLRPYAESRGMSQTVIPYYVGEFGLNAKVRIDGNRDVIKALVANDVPVIVLQWIRENWRLGHFRVVQGYDDTLGVFYVNDSLLGPNLAIPYDSFDARWDYNWSRYIPIYDPSQIPTVAAILGPDWDDKGMFARRLPDLKAQVKADPNDWQTWGRLVEALIGAERFQEALDTHDYYTARRGSTPVSTQSNAGGAAPFQSASSQSTTRMRILNKLERYEEALAASDDALARGVASSSGAWGSASLWLQRGDALRGLGRVTEARAAYQRAVAMDGPYTEAGDRLASLS